MEIIRNWLTLKLGLEIPKPEDFEKDLANGVLIAEILRKYGVLSDDEEISLKHDNTVRTRLANIKHIEKWLTGSGVKIRESDLEDVAMERKGVGIKLLYELFLFFEFEQRCSKIDEEKEQLEIGKSSTSSDYKNYDPRICTDKQSTQVGSIYTSHDRIEFPRRVVLQKPFLESSEAAQVQHLYFCLKTLQILRKQDEERLNFKQERQFRMKEFEQGQMANCDKQEVLPPKYKLDSVSIQRRQEDRRSLAQASKLKTFLDDMDAFDLVKGTADPRCASEIPVYADGRGDPCEYDLKIRRMRCMRRRRVQRGEERSRMRTEVMNRFTQATPLKMQKSLEKEVMSCLTKLPASERLLAAYLQRCQEERQHFIDHAVYEARQLQAAMDKDLTKEYGIQVQDEEFQKYAASEVANPHKTFDFVCRVLEEPDLIQKLATSDDTIKDMLQRALKIKGNTPPPPPPCTPTFVHRKRCKKITHRDFGQILVCEDEIVGESGFPEISYCRVLPEFTGEQE